MSGQSPHIHIDNGQKSFFENLWERRFLQYTFSYLIGSWAFIQFVDWFVIRYHLSPSWTEVFLVFLVSLLPSVLLFTYFHGRPGPDRWQKIEKIIIPVNVIISLVLVFVLFSGKALGSTQTSVEVVNEEGVIQQRIVPTAAFSQRFVMFPLENGSGEQSEDWLRFIMPMMQGFDLEQDYRIHAIHPFELLYEFQAMGEKITDEIPFSSQLKIAQDNYSDFFVSGIINSVGDLINVTLRAYQSDNGRLFFESTFEEDHPTKIVDAFSVALTEQLYIKDALYSDKTIVDLPAGNLFSYSMPALKKYVEGTLYAAGGDMDMSIATFEAALADDPDFVRMYNELGILYLMTNQVAKKDSVIKIAMQRMSALPEREQMYIKLTYFQPNQLQKIQALLDMWMDLYPHDSKPYEVSIRINRMMQNLNVAFGTAKKAYARGHRGKLVKTLATICVDLNKIDSAKIFLREFAELYPDKAKDDFTLGEIYLREKNFAAARKFFDDLAILDPTSHKIALKQAEVAGRQRRYDAELKHLDEALSNALQYADTVAVLTKLEGSYMNRGRITESLSTMDKRIAMAERKQGAFAARIGLIFYPTIFQYGLIDQLDVAQARVDSFRAVFPLPEGTQCAAELNFALGAEDLERLEETLAQCRTVLEELQGQAVLMMADAFKSYLEENHAEAVRLFTEFGEATGLPEDQLAYLVGKSERLAGNLKDAKQTLENGLSIEPGSSYLMFELAETALAMKDTKLARTMVDQLTEVWNQADAPFIYLPRLEEMQSALSMQ